MPHIHNEPGQHDLVVTAYIIRNDGEPRGLLHMHRKVGKLLPIGGHVELGETPWQAVAHELREESGYDLADLKIYQPPERLQAVTGAVLHPQPACVNTHSYTGTGHFHTELTYVFLADGAPKHAMDEGESTDLRWYSRGGLDSLGTDTAIPLALDLYRYALDTVMKRWKTVDTSVFTL